MLRLLPLVLPVCALVACECSSREGGSRSRNAPLFEFRLVHDEPRPNSHVVEYDGDTLYLDPRVALSDSDIRHVEPTVESDQLSLMITFTREGARRLEALTGANIGKRLVVFLDSRVRMDPGVIRDTIRGGESGVRAAFDIPQREAERIAAAIRTRWPDEAR